MVEKSVDHLKKSHLKNLNKGDHNSSLPCPFQLSCAASDFLDSSSCDWWIPTFTRWTPALFFGSSLWGSPCAPVVHQKLDVFFKNNWSLVDLQGCITWTWVNSRRWWGTGKPGVLQAMGSQGVGHDFVTEQQYIYTHTYIYGKGTRQDSGHKVSRCVCVCVCVCVYIYIYIFFSKLFSIIGNYWM